MTIKERQNSEEILELQYLAKYSYNMASRYNIWIFVLTIASVLALLANTFWIQIIFTLIIIGLQILKKRSIDIGALAKSFIDRTLFGLEIRVSPSQVSELKEKALEVIDKNQEDYNLKKSHDGLSEVRGIRNWYTVGNKEHEEVVYQCQCENLYWDKRMVKIYSGVLLILLVVSTFFFYLLNKYSSRGIGELLSIYFNVYSTLLVEFLGIGSYIFYSVRIDEKKEDYEENVKDIEDRKRLVLALQVKIEKRRKQLYTIPDILHKLNSSKFHKRWKKCGIR